MACTVAKRPILFRFIPNPWAVASREGRSARLALLAEMAGKLLGEGDPDAVLRVLMARAPEDLGLDVCLSYAADDGCEVLRATFAAGLSEAALSTVECVPYGSGLCGQVARGRQPLVLGDLVYSDAPEAQAMRRAGVRAYAGFPLLTRGASMRLLGVLSFGSKRVDAFADEDVGFLATVASHVEAVHQRIASDKALRDSEARFRTLADSIPQLAWMARPDGWIFWYNRRWHDFTGTALEEMRGWGWQKVLHPDHVDRVVARIQRCWDTGEPWEDTFPLRGRDGGWRWFLSRALPVRDDDGRIVMWFGTNTDVTERREAEEELKTARDEAEAARREAEIANRSKSGFLAAASHDLRQPLQSMLLLTGVLETEIKTGRGRDVLVHLQRGMDALKVLLDGLLDVSRLDAGVVTPQMRDFRLADLFEEVASTFQAVAEGKGLEWRMRPRDLVLHGDQALLARILRNLVENAVRYTPGGHVALSCREDGQMAEIAVEDTGIGIPADHLDRIWDEFHQVGNSERDRSQGTGLGLAIVRRLATLMELEVRVESWPGAGSRFTVRVPLGEAAPEERPEAAIAGAEGRLALVVDDDAMILLGLQAILREWGYQVLIAGSGEQAVERVAEAGRAPDVVVSDYRLRDGEVGTQAIDRVRAMAGHPIPGILLTGEGGTEAETAATGLGLGFIHKPVTPRQLAAAMARCLG
ncbi:MAG: ATP-binding protein [Pseudomonadota bacterium]